MSDDVVQEFRCARCAHVWQEVWRGAWRGVCPECACAARCAPDGSLNHPPPSPAEKAAFHAPVESAWGKFMQQRGLEQSIPDMLVYPGAMPMAGEDRAKATAILMQMQVALERQNHLQNEAARVMSRRDTDWYRRTNPNIAPSYEMMERMKDMRRLIDHQGQSIAALTKDNQNLRAENAILRAAPPQAVAGNTQFRWDCDLGQWVAVAPHKQSEPPTEIKPIFRAISVRDKQPMGVFLP